MNEFSQKVAARVEELLREQLIELGENPTQLAPHEISENMQCDIFPDESMIYTWKGTAILRVEPEKDESGKVIHWRMFTRDDTETDKGQKQPVQ